ncbi:MAG: bifunctional metallophosphatase/5'-nucleotidase [Spirochaetia bacterium]|nr:bifunctional metallophosphatase/5'-nucleotidase [Spirochaetia bacterium]
MKKYVAVMAAILAVLAVGCASSGAAPAAKALAADVGITIVHTNDMHGRGLETSSEVGYPKIAGYVEGLKAAGKNVLVLDAGDTIHGLPWVNLERGTPVIKLMNAVGYDAMVPGNHDFNYGQDRLFELAKEAKFPILAANIYKDGARALPAYVIKEVGGVRVAIVGLSTQETTYKSDPTGLKGLVFEHPVGELARLVRSEIAGLFDVLVVVSHIGLDGSSNPVSADLLESVPEIDLIIDGHSHSSLESARKTEPRIVSTGANGVGVGVVELTIGKDRKVAAMSAKTLGVKSEPALVSSAAVKAMTDEIQKAQAPLFAEVIGKSAVLLEGTRGIVRTSETNLGRLIAWGMKDAAGSDIAMMNGGGIRVSIPAGDITKGIMYTVLPFGNYVWSTTLKGSELDAIIEHGVGKLPDADGRYPHFANLTFTLDATKPAGDRVSNIMVGGVAVDPAKNYSFATLNFLFAGGDGYTMLTGRTYKEFIMDADAFIKRLQKIGTVVD